MISRWNNGEFVKRWANKSKPSNQEYRLVPHVASSLFVKFVNLLTAKEFLYSFQLSQTPERMEKIYDWVKKSTGRGS